MEAAIVGSGPNGLAAAIVLAQQGHRVRVHEAEPTIGGGARTAELTLPGFLHDVCSAIHPLAASSPFLTKLPLGAHGLEWIQPDVPLAHPLDDGTAVVLYRSLERTAAELGRDGPAYRRMFGPLVSSSDDLGSEILSPLVHLPRHPLLLARFGLLGLLPARQLAIRSFSGEPARALFAGLAAHSFLSLDAAFSAAFGLMLGLCGHVVGWPLARGGSQRIANALASYLRTLGGEIVTGERVERLADLPHAAAYLFDTSPRSLERIAGDRLPERYRAMLRAYRHGPGVFKIDYALAGPTPWLAEACRRAGTVHVGGTLADIVASEAEVARGRHPERPFVLVAQPSIFDASRAPAGKHTLWAYCHVPSRSTFDMAERIEAQIERFAPGFRDVVLARSTHDTRSVEALNANMVGGDISGGSNSWPQLFARPRLTLDPYATPDRAITLCSAATPPGGGVHGMCGYHAARSALRRSFARDPERADTIRR